MSWRWIYKWITFVRPFYELFLLFLFFIFIVSYLGINSFVFYCHCVSFVSSYTQNVYADNLMFYTSIRLYWSTSHLALSPNMIPVFLEKISESHLIVGQSSIRLDDYMKNHGGDRAVFSSHFSSLLCFTIIN